jgi:hypothetical protein
MMTETPIYDQTLQELKIDPIALKAGHGQRVKKIVESNRSKILEENDD